MHQLSIWLLDFFYASVSAKSYVPCPGINSPLLSVENLNDRSKFSKLVVSRIISAFVFFNSSF